MIIVENSGEKIVRAIKVDEQTIDEKKNFKLITFKFKEELRLEEEVFKTKKDAEDFLSENKNK